MDGPLAAVVWHDAENGAYDADMAHWEELAEATGGPVLDIGCGTGRVALRLAKRGHQVVGVDLDPVLVEELRARAIGLPAEAAVGDARRLDLGRQFNLVLAPMQLVQLLADETERLACLAAISAHLVPGGLAALAIVEDPFADQDMAPFSGHRREERFSAPLPDTREVGGVVYSSLPLPTLVDRHGMEVRRLRQTVSADGELAEEESAIRLRRLSAAQLEREARAAGLEPRPRRAIPPTDDHVGSTVVLLRKGVA
jgi:SAM-dependent methyltransferase